MSATQIENFAIVFPDPLTLPVGSQITPSKLAINLSFDQRYSSNLQTLSTNDADPDGLVQGLLYVPDLDPADPCFNATNAIMPPNVTRQANLPNTDFNIIALAPWLSVNCTKAFLASAHFDPLRAFIFYLPDNGTTQPPPISSPVWNMNDGGAWKGQSRFPVYAVPGSIGNQMMEKLNQYSGNMSTVPFGHKLMDLPLDPRSYIRVYTTITITIASSMPALWVFLLIVIGGLIFILACTSLLMHWIQRRRRASLRRRIENGTVDLEALGIKRLTVPKPIIDGMPLFIYTCNEEEMARGWRSQGSNQPDIEPTDQREATEGISEHTKPSTASADVEQSQSTISAHDYLRHAQPTCPICLDDFESGSTTIRELPCGHIFHPECIDSFLSNNSSLCPMCKKSTLPLGYCPEVITNAMVRRERALRRLRSRIIISEDGQNIEPGWEDQIRAFARRVFIGQNEDDRDLEPNVTTGVTPIFDPNLELRTRRSIASQNRPRQQNIGLSRQETTQQRTTEILADRPVAEDVDTMAERPQSRWRTAIGKVFPGFK